jgi:hypothetical protein
MVDAALDFVTQRQFSIADIVSCGNFRADSHVINHCINMSLSCSDKKAERFVGSGFGQNMTVRNPDGLVVEYSSQIEILIS